MGKGDMTICPEFKDFRLSKPVSFCSCREQASSVIGGTEEQLQLLLGVFYVSTRNFSEGHTRPLGKHPCCGVWLGDLLPYSQAGALLTFPTVPLRNE